MCTQKTHNAFTPEGDVCGHRGWSGGHVVLTMFSRNLAGVYPLTIEFYPHFYWGGRRLCIILSLSLGFEVRPARLSK